MSTPCQFTVTQVLFAGTYIDVPCVAEAIPGSSFCVAHDKPAPAAKRTKKVRREQLDLLSGVGAADV